MTYSNVVHKTDQYFAVVKCHARQVKILYKHGCHYRWEYTVPSDSTTKIQYSRFEGRQFVVYAVILGSTYFMWFHWTTGISIKNNFA